MRIPFRRISWFTLLSLAVLIIFFAFRPLNSPQYRIIVADGLGYYAYLPAKFIYNDDSLNFAWFDKVFEKHYDNHLFEHPRENFLVPYGDRMINLYYPGMSLLQSPFFFLSHAWAKVSNYPPDGFSFPYQLGVGISALFYTLLGLYFCNKLIFNISKDQKLSMLIPLLVFFGTNLFTFSIFNGCYTHCYSFCFLALAAFHTERLFSLPHDKLYHLLLIILFSLTMVFIRPFNVILLSALLFFAHRLSLRSFRLNKKTYRAFIPPLLLIAVTVLYNTRLLYTMTGSVLPNTYTIGKFYFWNWRHFADNLYGFQSGLLWYTPLLALSFLTVFYLRRNYRIIFLLVPIAAVLILYSFWFYWNIVNRTLVELSPYICILLALQFEYLRPRRTLFRAALVLAFVCTTVFQLKAYQLRNGILDANYTWSKYYFRDFFRLKHKDVYPADPSAVIKKVASFYDFEQNTDAWVTKERSFEGEKAMLLNNKVEFSPAISFSMPFTEASGVKKVRASFWFFKSREINDIQLVFRFSRNDSALHHNTFYINQLSVSETWDHKEFGTDYPQGLDTNCKMEIYFWNAEKKDTAFIDNLKVEFLLTDGSNEVPVFEMPE